MLFIHSRNSRAGFTLMEFLVALFIFALITSTLFGSFSGVFSRATDLERELAFHEMGLICLSHLQRELKEIYVPLPPAYKKPTSDSSPNPYRIVGDVSEIGSQGFGRLRFTPQTELPVDSLTVRPTQAVVYYVAELEDGQKVLKRALRPNDEKMAEFEPHDADVTLCERIAELELNYFNSEGDTQDTWDSESDDQDYATPRAIRISMALGEDPEAATQFETTVVLPVWRNPLES
jgi:general secretion pathway protein J